VKKIVSYKNQYNFALNLILILLTRWQQIELLQ
jgi:hypothetical protein